MKNNIAIRTVLMETGVKLYEVADALEISETTMTRRMRHELPEADQKKIIGIIKKIARKG